MPRAPGVTYLRPRPPGVLLPTAAAPRGVPHADMMDNHALWALFENPTPIQVASLIGDESTNQVGQLLPFA